MKLINKALLSLVLTGTLLVSSCDSLVQVDPRQSIDADGALTTPDAMNAALNSVYSKLRSARLYGRDLLAVGDALADIGQTTSNSGRLIGENNNNPGAHFGTWQIAYFAINEANLILDGISKVEGASAAQIARWEGEAKFLRGLYYFDLVKVYSYMPTAIYEQGVIGQGGIPVVTEGVISSGAALSRQTPRSTILEVYAQIYKDLEDAKRLLPTGRGVQYGSAAAASALLSRVALYRGDYSKVVTESGLALASNVGTVLSGSAYVNGWRAPVNPESMFEVRFALAEESIGVNESLQSTYTALLNLTNKNSQGGWGDFIPNATVRGLFGLTQVQLGTPATDNNNWDVTRNADVRAQLFTSGNTVRGAGRQIENTKFLSKSGFAYADNVPVIRKSEMHLNRAEANFQLKNEAAALTELNAFKGLRGLPAVTLSGNALLEEILLERLKEFIGEGHRFFDLKRYGRAIVKTTPAVILAFDDFKFLPPIPQREVDGNPNIKQNRGY